MCLLNPKSIETSLKNIGTVIYFLFFIITVLLVSLYVKSLKLFLKLHLYVYCVINKKILYWQAHSFASW